jgi:hypothetical protein
VLAVVEDDQGLASAERRRQGRQIRLDWLFVHPNDGGYRLPNAAGCDKPRQVDEPDAVWIYGKDLVRQAKSQSGLASSANACEREQGSVFEEGAEVGEFMLASDEAGEVGPEVVRWNSLAARLGSSARFGDLQLA